jgi:hypothetical protein
MKNKPEPAPTKIKIPGVFIGKSLLLFCVDFIPTPQKSKDDFMNPPLEF